MVLVKYFIILEDIKLDYLDASSAEPMAKNRVDSQALLCRFDV